MRTAKRRIRNSLSSTLINKEISYSQATFSGNKHNKSKLHVTKSFFKQKVEMPFTKSLIKRNNMQTAACIKENKHGKFAWKG